MHELFWSSVGGLRPEYPLFCRLAVFSAVINLLHPSYRDPLPAYSAYSAFFRGRPCFGFVSPGSRRVADRVTIRLRVSISCNVCYTCYADSPSVRTLCLFTGRPAPRGRTCRWSPPVPPPPPPPLRCPGRCWRGCKQARPCLVQGFA